MHSRNTINRLDGKPLSFAKPNDRHHFPKPLLPTYNRQHSPQHQEALVPVALPIRRSRQLDLQQLTRRSRDTTSDGGSCSRTLHSSSRSSSNGSGAAMPRRRCGRTRGSRGGATRGGGGGGALYPRALGQGIAQEEIGRRVFRRRCRSRPLIALGARQAAPGARWRLGWVDQRALRAMPLKHRCDRAHSPCVDMALCSLRTKNECFALCVCSDFG